MACADSIRLEEVEPTGPDPSPGNTKATTPDATHARPAITPPIAPHWTSLEVGIFSSPLSLAITVSCHPKKPYSPKCLEGEFCELRVNGFLRRSFPLDFVTVVVTFGRQWCCRVGVVTEGTRDYGRGSGGMSTRAAPWLAWSLVTLSVVLVVGGITLAQMTRSTAPERPYYGSVTLSVLALAFSVVGAIIASRQPRNAIGWLFCGVGVTIGLSSFAGDYAEFWLASRFGRGVLGETAAWFASWSWTLLVYLPTSFLLLLFPDGRLPSPRWRPVAWCAVLGLIGFLAGYTLEPGPLEDFPRIMNPYGVDSLILEAVAVAGAILASASMVASAISLIVRMRRAGRAQRQQIKWLVFVGGVISVWIGEVGFALTSIGLLGVPIFTGVAITRYRLYEIDIVINRTLVYGALTTALVAVY